MNEGPFDVILENESWFVDMIRDVDKAVILLTLEGKVLFINGKAEAMTGVALREASGKKFMEVLCLENKNDNTCIPFSTFIEKMGSDRKYVFPENIVVKDIFDKTLPVKGYFQAITDNYGAKLRMLAIFDEKMPNDFLYPDLPGERYKWISELMSDAIVMIDSKAIITYANRKLCHVLGYALVEMIGESLSLFMDENNWKIVMRQIELRRQGKEDPYEVQLQTKTGETMVGAVSPKALFSEKGEFRGTFAVVRDITENKRNEKEIGLMRMAMEQANDGIAILDLKGNILFNNPSFCYMLGFDAKKDKVCKLDDIFKKTGRANRIKPALEKTIESGYHIEKMDIGSEALVQTMIISMTLVRDENNLPSQIVCMLQDVTEQDKISREIIGKDSVVFQDLLDDLSMVISVSGDLAEHEFSLERKIKLSQIKGLSRNLIDKVTRIRDERADQLQRFPVNIKKMQEMMENNEEVIGNFINSFLLYFPSLVKQASQYMVAGEVQKATETVHKMKGTAGYLGNLRLTTSVVDMLEALRNGDLEKARHLFKHIPKIVEDIVDYFNAHKEKSGGSRDV